MIVSFVNIVTDPPQDDSIPLRAELTAHSEQTRGLGARLRITNVGENAVRLANPYTGASYQVTDTEGWPVSIAAPVSSKRIKPPPPPSSRAPYLALTKVEVASSPVAVDVAISTPEFDLPAAATIEFRFRIDAVLTAHQSATSGPPAPGEYHLTFLLPLAWHDVGGEEKHTRIVRTAEPLTITVVDPS